MTEATPKSNYYSEILEPYNKGYWTQLFYRPSELGGPLGMACLGLKWCLNESGGKKSFYAKYIQDHSKLDILTEEIVSGFMNAIYCGHDSYDGMNIIFKEL